MDQNLQSDAWWSRIVLLSCAAAAAAAAFVWRVTKRGGRSTQYVAMAAVSGHKAPGSNKRVPTVLAASSQETETETAAGAVAENKTAEPPAAMMDSNIYNLNKFIIDTVYATICLVYPVRGTDRDFARFFVLETVARVPYFAYLSVMHLRETFGQRGEGMSDRMRTHYAEADNELHHLLIMESLGGNSSVVDRTLAQTMAFFYYWYVIGAYALSEQTAYHLSELIEDHAYNTYNKYLTEHEEMLKSKPVPDIARKYYELDNPFLFDLFCTVKDRDKDGQFSLRRPKLESLYDVFTNVRDDEKEHWKTLCNLVQFNDMQGCDAKQVRSTEAV
jgi:ubiquinol oxidase